MATKVYQIKLELAGSKPNIWRKLLIPADMLLSDLHKVIQTTMGWTNSHLHQFIKGRVFLEPPMDDDFMDSTGIDYTDYTADSLLEKKNDKISYEYDFGDGWEHIITLENVIENYKGTLPVCTGGAMNCPPEDVGGIGGFQEFKKALKNPSHLEHEIYKKWIGEHYDPEYFDSEEINKMLKEDNFGVFEW
ncbi:MAG: plasmid pRiA4b ORF-3 family protein [Balneolaceae bacterium]|nr:plasmid pRiA4b ORF-3 family protein [Balneolaceae bacterium]